MTVYQDWITEEGLTVIEGYAREGLIDKEIAGKIGISLDTLNNWKVKFPQVKEALKKGKQVVDFEVEKKLLTKALGQEVITDYVIDGKGNKKAVKKTLPSDTTAIIFWLKNRMPEKWRDKRDIDVEGGIPVIIKEDIEE